MTAAIINASARAIMAYGAAYQAHHVAKPHISSAGIRHQTVNLNAPCAGEDTTKWMGGCHHATTHITTDAHLPSACHYDPLRTDLYYSLPEPLVGQGTWLCVTVCCRPWPGRCYLLSTTLTACIATGLYYTPPHHLLPCLPTPLLPLSTPHATIRARGRGGNCRAVVAVPGACGLRSPHMDNTKTYRAPEDVQGTVSVSATTVRRHYPTAGAYLVADIFPYAVTALF